MTATHAAPRPAPRVAPPDGPALPRPRGPRSAALFAHWRHGTALPAPPPAPRDPLADDDLQLALYCCYELHYRGFAGVGEQLEWDLPTLAYRAALESQTEAALRRATDAPQAVDAVAELRALCDGDGPSLSGWVLAHADVDHVRELAVHRSAYQLKEADPHTWAIPRVTGRTKAALVEIQADEYGGGEPGASHAELFADTMTALGLDATYGAYLDRLPGCTLATTNLISMLGLHRRLRGALLGHLAVFEMTSVGPMGRYAATVRRLGLGDAAARFYDVHVEADEHHGRLAVDGLVEPFLREHPEQAREVVFGARALTLVEGTFARHLRSAWSSGASSLRPAPSHRRLRPAVARTACA